MKKMLMVIFSSVLLISTLTQAVMIDVSKVETSSLAPQWCARHRDSNSSEEEYSNCVFKAVNAIENNNADILPIVTIIKESCSSYVFEDDDAAYCVAQGLTLTKDLISKKMK